MAGLTLLRRTLLTALAAFVAACRPESLVVAGTEADAPLGEAFEGADGAFWYGGCECEAGDVDFYSTTPSYAEAER